MFFEYNLGELLELLPKIIVVFEDGQIVGVTKLGYFLAIWLFVSASTLYSLRKEQTDMNDEPYTKLTRTRDALFIGFILCLVGLLVLFVVDFILFGLYTILL